VEVRAAAVVLALALALEGATPLTPQTAVAWFVLRNRLLP
jgi:hypothetical protein